MARLSSVQRLNPIGISNLKFQISDLKWIIVLSKFGKSVDRRQYLATEATRPSRASTGLTDGRREVWLFFALKQREKDRRACSSVGYSARLISVRSVVRLYPGPPA